MNEGVEIEKLQIKLIKVEEHDKWTVAAEWKRLEFNQRILIQKCEPSSGSW